MKRHGMLFLLLYVIIWAFSSIANAEMKIHKNGYEITLPDDWVEVPSNVIMKYETMLAELNPNAEKQHFDSAFQLSSKKSWLEYPYIFISVKNVGKMPESKLKKIQEVSMQKITDARKQNFSSIISNIRAGEMAYDGQNRMIWAHFEANVHNIGPVIGITGIIPTEKGFIQVNSSSKKDTFSIYEPVFRSITTSITPSPELTYKPKCSDIVLSYTANIDWAKPIARTIAGAIIGGIIVVVIRVRKKNRRVGDVLNFQTLGGVGDVLNI